MRQLAGLLIGLILLTACKNVPDVQSVPVPADGSVMHGHYSGTLTEQMQFVDARLTNDGASVFALLASAGHSVLLDLDPATGAVRRRLALAAESPQALGIMPEGTLIVAANNQSLKVSPVSLRIMGVLPAAFQVSADGTRLLGSAPGYTPQDRYRRWLTSTGAEVPTARTEWATSGLTQDLEWNGGNGQTLINMSSGKQVTLELLPSACSSDVGWARRPLEIGSSADGFYVLENDATLHRFDASGKITESIALHDGCATYAMEVAPMVIQNGTLRLIYGVYDKSSTPQVSLLTWKPGQSPAYTGLLSGSPLPGSAQSPAFPFLKAKQAGPQILMADQRWTVSLPVVQLPVSGDFVATYSSGTSYTITGTVTVNGQVYDAAGTGTTSDGVSPRLLFTQALCSPSGRSLVAGCPTMDWRVNLTAQGATVGSLSGDGLLPSGRWRRAQNGAASLSTLNEDGLQDSRAFRLSLQPN
jgi:hypothetical protein